MKRYLFTFTLIFCLPGIASAYTACTSSITRELETCAKNNFEESDKSMTVAYRNLAGALSAGDKTILLKTQRAWILYKQATCQGAYDATFPGEEAGIDKWTCLNEITRARKHELEYLSSGVGGDEFFRAADKVSKLYEHGNRGNFVSKLVNEFSKESDAAWHEYVINNCILATSRVQDARDECVARQQFYNY
jgi:uncharacterized protein YecT (DUF1311 family)